MTSSDDALAEFYPEFTKVWRGYDPDEVEQVLDELYSSLGDAAQDAERKAALLATAEESHEHAQKALAVAQQRIAELESRPAAPAPSFDTVGAQVAEILNAASVEAAEILRLARAKAQAHHDESEAAAVTSRAETDHYANDIRSAADAEAAAVRDQAKAEAEQMLAEARMLRESQHRADVEAYERLAADLADRQGRAEAEFADQRAAHQRRLAALTRRIDAMTDELSEDRSEATAQADAIVAEARRQAEIITAEAERRQAEVAEQRAQLRAQLAAVRERLQAVVADGPDEPRRPPARPRRATKPSSAAALTDA